MEKLSELETQQKIYNLILKEPGLHIRKIEQLLNLDVSLIIYHLHYLEIHDLIAIEREKGYSRCYVKGKIGSIDKKRLSLLRREIPIKIVLFLLKNPSSQHKQILEQVDIVKSTLSYHLDKLVKHGILRVQMIANEQRYLVCNEKEIIQLLIQYNPSIITFGFTDTWADFTVFTKEERKKKE
ncbi:MAG: winged helix-turn-helix transcriptional regulator [Methanobacteriota archaeon]